MKFQFLSLYPNKELHTARVFTQKLNPDNFNIKNLMDDIAQNQESDYYIHEGTDAILDNDISYSEKFKIKLGSTDWGNIKSSNIQYKNDKLTLLAVTEYKRFEPYKVVLHTETNFEISNPTIKPIWYNYGEFQICKSIAVYDRVGFPIVESAIHLQVYDLQSLSPTKFYLIDPKKKGLKLLFNGLE